MSLFGIIMDRTIKTEVDNEKGIAEGGKMGGQRVTAWAPTFNTDCYSYQGDGGDDKAIGG
ncbi:MAG: hypothetical protein RPU52_02460 [Candidatus Sedimenticola sp. (ex Thyasira tokunagai)]